MKKIIVAVLTVGALGVFTTTLVRAVWVSPQLEVTDNSKKPTNSNKAPVGKPSDPKKINIPSLGVDASVQHVGVAKSGNMAVPSNYTDVGWYRYGPSPGEPGSATFDGHVDNALSLPGVFKDLHTVKVGADIYIERNSGELVHFKVVDMQTYPYQEVPRERVFSTTGTPRLTLITCDGDWIQGEKTYDTRLVVYAELVNG